MRRIQYRSKVLIWLVLVAGIGWLESSAAVLLVDHFTYPDGPLVPSSHARWSSHSGKSNELDVVSGELQLTQSRTEDAGAWLSGAPFLEDHPFKVFFVKFQLRFQSIPTAAGGGLFAHFKDDAGGFRGRLWTVTQGASAGSVRLGVSWSGTAPTGVHAREFVMGAHHVVLIKFETDKGRATLWVDPKHESDASVVSSDTASGIDVERFAFRQNSGIGRIAVDRLVVATTFAEALGDWTREPSLPELLTQPRALTIEEGESAEFKVVALRATHYQWKRDGIVLPGQTHSALSIPRAAVSDAGLYQVVLSNATATLTSEAAKLEIIPRGVFAPEAIAGLRRRVLPPLFLPEASENVFSAEGIVTSTINVAGIADASFFLQDPTAGIAVFWKGGAKVFVPQHGDRVRVIAPLGHFNGLLQLSPEVTQKKHHVEVLERNQSVPIPMEFDFSEINDVSRLEAREGSRIAALAVGFASNAEELVAGSSIRVTNRAGSGFTVRLDSRLPEPLKRPKPPGTVNITGMLSQFDTVNPRTNGYQILVDRWEDIRSISPPPELSLTNRLRLLRPGDAATNRYLEHALLPGEQLHLSVVARADASKLVNLIPLSAVLPATAQWSVHPPGKGESAATFLYTPTSADAGRFWTFRLRAQHDEATNGLAFTVYVPTVLEQRVVIGEFLANPSTNAASPLFNPLRRSVPLTLDPSLDEFVEIVNLTEVSLDLAGWSLSDSARLRHRFVEPYVVGSSNAVVVYGGPLGRAGLAAEIPAVPASEGSAGLGLNNGGGDSIELRNPEGRLVSRVVYDSVPSNGSWTRFPSPSGAFTNHAAVSSRAFSPGFQYDLRSYGLPALGLVRPTPIQWTRISDGLHLRWTIEPGRKYTVERSEGIGRPFVEFDVDQERGEFLDRELSGVSRFYRLKIH